MSYARSLRKYRRTSFAKAFTVGFALIIAMQLIYTAVAMVMLGAAHSQDARVPAFGFWTVLFVGSALRCLIDGAQVKVKQTS